MILSKLRALDPGMPLSRILFFRLCWGVTWLAMSLIYRLRVAHRERVPPAGPLLVIANHQSHLDPPTIGVALRGRNIVPIARMGLFKNRLFGWLLARLNSIPINEKEGDTVAIRKAIQALGQERCILIFPEGARSPNGQMHEFKRGAWVIISRAKCPVLPVAVDGLYDAWPRSRKLPRLWRQRAAVAFGEVLDYDRLIAMGPDNGLAFLAQRVAELREEAAKLIKPARA